MGSTKKHKIREKEKERESLRKRKHHSRSRSPEKPKERHRHHKRHHKDRKREKLPKDKNGVYSSKPEDYDSDDDVVLVPPPPKISRPVTPPPPNISSSKSDQSLSIEETNKLRARLGLKPLKVEDIPSLKAGETPKSSAETLGGTDLGEFVHRPAENLTAKTKTAKLKQKLSDRRTKRHIDSKLAATKPLGQSGSDDDTSAWVERSRKQQEQRRKAAEMEKMLQQLDAEFGVGDLVEEDLRNERRDAYSTSDLRGLRVQHAADGFSEGRTVILTLKDQAVLDESEDVLVNVNMIDDERYRKNVEVRKRKPGYNAFEDHELDDLGQPQKPDVLAKYDEEIDGEKTTSFALGEDVTEARRQRALVAIREKLQQKTIVSLVMPELTLASEYFSPQEMEAKFKKTRKKVRKIRQKPLKAEDLVPLGAGGDSDLGSRNFRSNVENVQVKMESAEEQMDTEDLSVVPDLSDVKMEVDDSELELQLALRKARKLQQRHHNLDARTGVDKVIQAILEEGEGPGGSIVLNATAEFCRTLGDIPTYGLAGNRDQDEEELMDFERELNDEKKRQEEEGRGGAWNEVEIEKRSGEHLPLEVPILDAEPDVGVGVAGALRLAVSKGYLEKEDMNKPSASRFAHLQAQNYSIEDKTHIDEDKFGRRERYNGPTSDFKEKDGFKPNVKLDYIDDDGHVLNAKEAFRYLSHKFHGKGPGKNKVEKRMKKNEQEGLMKQMSSTDTPLGTLTLLQQKQRETQSAFVVLSGSKQTTSISKTKH